MARTYFAILGVSSNAPHEEIRSAYRRLAKELHPDRSGGDSRPFREIQEAYTVLSDSQRRREYERSLSRPAALRRSCTGMRSGPPVRDVDERSAVDAFFEWLWHGTSGRRRTQGLRLDVPLTREQAWRGGKAKVVVPVRTICPTCGGYGGIGLYACRQCAGEGVAAAELPLWVPFPSGLAGDHVVEIPFDRFGIGNLRVTVVFRPAM